MTWTRLEEPALRFSSWQPRQRAPLLVLILLAACRKQTGGECHLPTCQFATSRTHFVSGTITWTVGGAIAQVAGVAPAGSGANCEATTSPGKVGSAANPPDRQVEDTAVNLVCGVAGTAPVYVDGGAGMAAPSWALPLQYTVDPRAWVAGQVTSVRGNSADMCWHYRSSDSWEIVGTRLILPSYDISIVVEEATGGPTEFPAVVTADYRRLFRIGGTLAGRWLRDRTTCEEPATVTFSLELSQTASDFVVEAPMPCYGCD